MQCDLCDDTRWLLLDEEEGVGFVYGPCPKCSWLPRAQASIPAPIDSLQIGISDSLLIALGEEREWRAHGPAW